jgi:hypothetical protein
MAQQGRDLRGFLQMLERRGQLRRITSPVDPDLELAAIADRVLALGGPALIFENVRGSSMPVAVNLLGTVERVTRRAGWAAVVVMPGSNIVCLLVGHLKMAPSRFVALAAAGVSGRLALLWFGGKAVEDQIEGAVEWVNRYQWWIVGGLFALSFAQTARRGVPTPPIDPDEDDRPPA